MKKPKLERFVDKLISNHRRKSSKKKHYDLLKRNFDEKWYCDFYSIDKTKLGGGKRKNCFDLYLANSSRYKHSPNEFFNESWYLRLNPDVNKYVKRGRFINGYAHYLQSGKLEGRLALKQLDPSNKTSSNEEELERLVPGITYPESINTLKDIMLQIAPVKFAFDHKLNKKLNIFIPTLNEKIVFGGYTALFQFLKWIKSLGYDLRFIVCDYFPGFKKEEIIENCKQKNSLVYEVLHDSEIYYVGDRVINNQTDIPALGKDDICIAYSTWTSALAKSIAMQLNGKPLVFFIQEYESVFHSYDSMHAFQNSIYASEHIAIYNSEILMKYFRDNKIGYQENKKEIFFEHVLHEVKKPTLEELKSRKKKKLLFYARPEKHAKRNLFEMGMIVLKEALKRGYFNDTWEFYGIGALSNLPPVEIIDGTYLTFIERVGGEEYKKMLKDFDLGLSFIYAPHPGVVSLEMAQAGLITITNNFNNRDSNYYSNFSENILTCEPYIEEILVSLKNAIELTDNSEYRIKNSEMKNRPKSWLESFSHLESFVKENF